MPPGELRLLGAAHFGRGPLRHDVPDTVPGYLLAVLALRGDWVTRDELSVLFWPDAPTAEAQHNLRVNLYRLRSLLTAWQIDGLLETERRRLRLGLGTDIAQLRDELGRADWLAAASRPRGDFLQGMSFRGFAVVVEWVATQRDTLRSDWRRAILAAAPIATPDTQLDLAGRYLELDPFDESIMRTQATALLALGRIDDARRQLDRHDQRLRSEFGHGISTELFALVQQRPAAGAPHAPGDRPVADALVGRDADLAGLIDQVTASPLVTLSGLGGVGKTRLARAALSALAPRFGGSLWLSLADCSALPDLWRQWADRLGIALRGDADPLRQLTEQLAARSLLVVLDNAEQLLAERDALNAGLDALLAACPQLRLLVTSREPLRHPREQVLALRALALPVGDAAADVLAAPSVQLFVALARRARGGFEPQQAIDALARIARATGGLPLALRIAATWTRLLPCDDIAHELEAGLDALSGATPDSPGVRAVLDRSWRRLDASQRKLLAQLSAFAGAFDLAAAKAVGEATLAGLQALVDASLLDAGDSARFDLHPLARQFAREQLAAEPRWAAPAHERHARHVAQRLAPFADWLRADQRAALIAVGAWREDLLLAWQWALGRGDVDFIVQVAPVWSNWCEQKGRWDDGIALLAQAQATFDEHEQRDLAALAVLARGRALLLHRRADAEAAQALGRQALVWSRAIGHRAGVCEALNTLALILRARGLFDEALTLAREALTIAEADADTAGEALYAGTVAFLELMLGHYSETERLWRHVSTLHQRSGNWYAAAGVLNNLGNLLRGGGRLDEALPLLEEGLRLCDKHAFTALRPFVLANLGAVHFDAGHPDAAREFTALALAEARRHNVRQIEIASLLRLADLAMSSGQPAAAPHLVEGLRLAAAGGDISNQLEALDAYGRWLDLRGDTDAAARAWRVVLAHPRIHAELRDKVRSRLQAHGDADAQAPLDGGGVALLTEQALEHLRRADAPAL